MKRIRLIPALLVAAFVASSTVPASKKDPEPLRGCTIVFSHRELMDGTLVVTSVAVRYVSADGRWKETRTYPSASGPKNEVLTSDNRGVFQVHADKAVVLGHSIASAGAEASLQDYHSVAFLRRSPRFRREGEVAGLKTYVWQVSRPDAEGFYEEVEFAPQLGSIPLRSTTRSSDGTVVDEEVAISITSGNPPESAISSRADIQMDFSFLERKEKEEKKRGVDVTPLQQLRKALE